METLSLSELIGIIGLVERHDSLVVSELTSGFQVSTTCSWTSHQIEANCRILINMIVVASCRFRDVDG